MNAESGIWWRTPGDEDGESARGEVEIEVADADSIIVHFKVDGEVIANAELTRFSAGVLVGQLTGASELALA